MTLPTRTIGPFRVSAIALGCMNLSHAYGISPPEEEAVRLLNHVLDQGVTLLDTAAIYGGGNNERLVGRAVCARYSAAMQRQVDTETLAGEELAEG